MFQWLKRLFPSAPLTVGTPPREGIDTDDVQVGTLYRLAFREGECYCRVDAIETRPILGGATGYEIVAFTQLDCEQSSILSLEEFARRVRSWH